MGAKMQHDNYSIFFEHLKHINMSDTRQFLELLDPTTDNFTFQTIDDNSVRDDKRLLRTLHGSLDKMNRLNDLVSLNDRGAGVFITINQTTGRQRRKEDVVEIRSVFVDLDGAPLRPVYDHHIQPQIIVETSPGKFHVYWLTYDVPLDDFRAIQLALAERFNGDQTVCDLPRVMRLPGFFHRKREPFQTRIIRADDTPRYPGSIFARKPAEPHIANTNGPVGYREVMLAAAALEVIPPATEWHHRNYVGMAMWRATDGDPEAFEAWCKWLRKSGRYNEWHARRQWGKYGRYLQRSHKQPVGLGTLIAFANYADPDWRDRLIMDLMTNVGNV
jgi:hypothetical protein